MKSNTVLVLVIVLVIVNIAAINAWPFGFRGSLQGFKNQRVGKQGFQNVTAPSVPIMRMPQGPPGTTMPSATQMMQPTMPSTTMPSATMPSATMPSATQMMPSTTMPSQTSTPVVTPTVPMLPIVAPNTPAPVVAPPQQRRMDASGNIIQGFRNAAEMQGAEFKRKEGFTSSYLDNAGGAKDMYQPMGAFDGVNLPTGNKSAWRYTAPNEALLGAEFTPGDDSLFIFKNNQCKPECCGASFSCSGGCVCTTENQRDYINGRGGNRTSPADD